MNMTLLNYHPVESVFQIWFGNKKKDIHNCGKIKNNFFAPIPSIHPSIDRSTADIYTAREKHSGNRNCRTKL